MRNEYTDYIAHGHKYFAVIDLGKKNSKGTKLKRYFYSANEYKNYLAGKKTLDDKLMEATAKAYKKVKGIASTAKALPKLAKAVKNTNKEVKALKKSGLDEESARDEIRFRSADQHLARAGLKKVGEKGDRILAVDRNGKGYRMDRYTREITKPVHQTDPEYSKDVSKELIKKNPARAATKLKMPEISNNNSPYGKIGKAISKVVDKTVGEKVREDFMERMLEKGINKANAEALRKKLDETYDRATKISTSANNLKNRLDNLQEAFTSGDGDKALETMDDMLKDQEAIQKDILTIVDEMMPEAKKVADTFLDMGKKTLDTATAGPKDIAEEVKENPDNKTKIRDPLAVLTGPSSVTDDPDNMKKIQDAVNKAFEEKNKKRKK